MTCLKEGEKCQQNNNCCDNLFCSSKTRICTNVNLKDKSLYSLIILAIGIFIPLIAWVFFKEVGMYVGLVLAFGFSILFIWVYQQLIKKSTSNSEEFQAGWLVAETLVITGFMILMLIIMTIVTIITVLLLSHRQNRPHKGLNIAIISLGTTASTVLGVFISTKLLSRSNGSSPSPSP
jgi:hypothetical protein